jgi:hypothetical protein
VTARATFFPSLGLWSRSPGGGQLEDGPAWGVQASFMHMSGVLVGEPVEQDSGDSVRRGSPCDSSSRKA